MKKKKKNVLRNIKTRPGFGDTFESPLSEFLVRHKKKTGLANNEKVLIKWK